MGSSSVRRIVGLLLGGLLFTLTTLTLSDSRVTEGSTAAAMDACVVETNDIRRNHMDYLTHDRDSTVHQGIRDTQFSLNECINCHAGKDGNGGYKPINSKGQFCNVCHDYVAVSMDCFQCHRKIPEDKRPQFGLNSDNSILDHHRYGLMSQAEKSELLIEEGSAAFHARTQGE